MSECKKCGRTILWTQTEAGKNMPVDYDDELKYLWNDGQPVEFDPDLMTSHFATCLAADQFRKKGK